MTTNNNNKYNMSKLGVVAKFTGAVDDNGNDNDNDNYNNNYNKNINEMLMSEQLSKLTTTTCQQIIQKQQQQHRHESIYANANTNINTKPKTNANANANSISFTSNLKATKNKCLTSVFNSFSIQKELKVCTTAQQVIYEQENNNTNNNKRIKCEFEEYVEKETGLIQKGLQLQQQQGISLAQHKAKLKSDFFQNNNNLTEIKVAKRTLKKLPIFVIPEVSRVRQLVEKFDKMKVNSTQTVQTLTEQMLTIKPDSLQQRQSPCSDEGCNLAQSPYSSSEEDNESICTASTTIERKFNKHKEKVARSASSDSALGLEVEEPNVPTEVQNKRRMTLTIADLPLRPALLPLPEPTSLPDTPSTQEIQQSLQGLLAQTSVPSKVILEERVVELPVEDIRGENFSIPSSRRESTQSCISDYPLSECSGVRYMRTPSVVVSDYSDDVMAGITLEEIEYFRAKRVGRRCSSLDTAGTEREGDIQSDVSAASSCSNLYYCGSTISALDGNECYVNGLRTSLECKTNDCSNCGNISNEEDNTTDPDTVKEGQDLAALLAAQHLDKKQTTKKVGPTPTVVVSDAEN